MSKSLAVTAAAGFALCILFFALAFLIAGNKIFNTEQPLAAIRPLVDMATRKEWRWDGGDTLAVNAPMVLHYQPGGPPQVTVTGPAELLGHVRVGGGQIGSDTDNHHQSKMLNAVVSGMPIHAFAVYGNQQLDLGHIDQDRLDVRISGKGSVSASGRVSQLNLVIAGNGNANLGALSAQDAKVAIIGRGDVTLAPHQSLFLTVAGRGDIHLTVHPASLHKVVLGTAHIVEDGVPQADAPPAPPTPPDPSAPVSSAGGARSFLAGGSGKLQLGHFDGGEVKLTLTGSGSAEADGRVERLSVMVSGSGKARLGGLSARQAEVTISGSGNATIAPQDEAQITILGSGNVYLLTRPRKLEQNVMGSGRVIERY